MNIVVVTPPPSEPVTIATAFSHLRVDADPDEIEEHVDFALITGYVRSAREECEKYLRRAIVQQTLRLSVAAFPAGGAWRAPAGIDLLRPPLISVTQVSYRDAANAQQVVDAPSYYVTDELVPRLMFVPGFTAPALFSRPDAVAVTYVAGYPPDVSVPDAPNYAANVPQAIKSAVLLGIELLYDKHTPDEHAAIQRAQAALLKPLQIPLI